MNEEFKETKMLKFPFNTNGVSQLQDIPFGTNWPVVYILNNDTKAYVGESHNLYKRMKNHLASADKKDMEELTVFYDSHFNKSVILDLEASLIKMMFADGKYELINQNEGQDQQHNYYQKKLYNEVTFPYVWDLLKKSDLANKPFEIVLNSDLYKFSPYTVLNAEQYDRANSILQSLIKDVSCSGFVHEEQPVASQDQQMIPLFKLDDQPEEEHCEQLSLEIQGDTGKTYILKGEPGTGKSVVAVYLCQWLMEIINGRDADAASKLDLPLNEIEFFHKQNMKVGFVIPQTSLRNTLKKLFSKVEGLSADIVIGPADVTKSKYDVLIVEESHRLRKRFALPKYVEFDEGCARLNMNPKTSTELDWVMKQSQYQILIYDPRQSVKSSDIDRQVFLDLEHQSRTEIFPLKSQMRVLAGNDYIDYVSKIFSANPPQQFLDFSENYELCLYDSFTQMKKDLDEKNTVYGLSRIISGYGYPWTTKGNKKLYKVSESERPYDFMIEGIPLIWNSVKNDWIGSKHSDTEVGSIFTVQGYDLNYAAVIIGPELIYNEQLDQIVFVASSYYDRKNKEQKDKEALKESVLNTYRVLMTRGIRGTYVYAADPGMKEYLKRYLPSKS